MLDNAGEQLTEPKKTDHAENLGVYQPGPFREEAKAFFRRCVGEETYERAMGSEAGRRHHYVAARAFLSQPDWERFVWIEQHGTLAGFPE